MLDVVELKNKVLNNYIVTREDALELVNADLNELAKQANEIRKHFCGNSFDACTIINVKSGKCSENCIFCAQSIHHDTDIDIYPLIDADELKRKTLMLYDSGLKRISYVASGKSVSDNEFIELFNLIKELTDEYGDINLCVSLGILDDKQIRMLKKAGVDRIHNNLESSEDYFTEICTTHSYSDKLKTLDMIDCENVMVCSGGIFGLGETFEDRIDLAIELRQRSVKSIPINVLNPINGTPVENNEILSNDEVSRIIAIFRFINPDSYIRLAGGRLLLGDNGRKAFQSGANAAILGDMLTTDGLKLDDDLKLLDELGFKIVY
ncbi:biotin synthase BioB [Methanobrevibacter sp.]|uniref:biotin synthase BioB n=1 Tax=Methanobrevibacter sp. TaxID=66852 RepID=UPI00389011AD